MDYFIPADTNKLLKNNNLEAKNIDNYLLRLNKFTRKNFNPSKDKYEFNIKDVKGNLSFDKNKIINYYKNIKSLYPYILSISATNNWRLAIGIGSGSVYETSLTLHYIYGVPYIPAQSIKGAFRSYIIQKYFFEKLNEYENYKDFEKEVLEESNWFIDIFGSNDKQGKVIFFDAFSLKPEIRLDIMNNHYQKYYNGSEYPIDTQNPNPINFLTLKNTKFEFIISIKENFQIKIDSFQGEILDFLKEEFGYSLEIFGIGAKTSVGYGYFDIQNKEIKNLKEEAKKEAEEKERLASMTPAQRLIETYSDVAVLINDMKSGKIENFDEIKIELAQEIKKVLQKSPKTWDKAKKKALDRKNYIEDLLKS